jgi:hypothetical protein
LPHWRSQLALCIRGIASGHRACISAGGQPRAIPIVFSSAGASFAGIVSAFFNRCAGRRTAERSGREMVDVSLGARGAAQGNIADTLQGADPGYPEAQAGVQDWLSGIEKPNLTPRYYLTIGLLVLQEMFEFYDFF